MRPSKLLNIPSIFYFSCSSFATTQHLVTIGELEAQQNRNILLQAKVQGAQLQKQLEESDVTSSSETVSGFSGVTASLPSVSEQPTSKNRKELPIIMEINGKDKRLNAVLRMADVRQTSVTTGSPLHGTTAQAITISSQGATLSKAPPLPLG
ncbi:type IV pilus biogenesis protein PilP, partial [Salmonella enterica]|uniref:type IV pilus biogenesis protein PilP n=1 Tax=Salmonella enterica TaxID=28901 RepID=UPI00117B02DD